MAQKAEKMLSKILIEWLCNVQLLPRVWILEISRKAFRISLSVSGPVWKQFLDIPYPVANSLLEMAQTENLCPLSAPHQQFLPAVCTAFVVHYPVRAAPQSQSFTPKQQWRFAPPHLKHCASHNIFHFLWVQDLPINLAVSILPHSVYFASSIALLELFCL